MRQRTDIFAASDDAPSAAGLAVEAGFFDLGRFGYTDIRLNGANVDVVGMLPLVGRFSALGRIGLNYAHARATFAGTGAVNVVTPNPSKREINWKAGVGLTYDFAPAWVCVR